MNFLRMGSLQNTIQPIKVFIAGGCYAGLSAALNLLDLSSGLNPRMSAETYPHHKDHKNLPLEITIADERDGYCNSSLDSPI